MNSNIIQEYGLNTQEDVEAWIQEFAKVCYDSIIQKVNPEMNEINSSDLYDMPQINFIDGLNKEEQSELESLKLEKDSIEVQHINWLMSNQTQELLSNMPQEDRTKRFNEKREELLLQQENEITDREKYLSKKMDKNYVGHNIQGDNTIQLNRNFFNSNYINIFSLVHELTHNIRDKSIDYIERNKGYTKKDRENTQQWLNMNDDEDLNNQYIDPYIIEFFAELSEIITIDILSGLEEYQKILNHLDSNKQPNLEGFIEAKKYFDNDYINNFMNIAEEVILFKKEILETSSTNIDDKTFKGIMRTYGKHYSKFALNFNELKKHESYLNLIDSVDRKILSYFLEAIHFVFEEYNLITDQAKKTSNNNDLSVYKKMMFDLFDSESDTYSKELIELSEKLKEEPFTKTTEEKNVNYLIAKIAISENYDTLKEDWPNVLKTDEKEINLKYFEKLISQIDKINQPYYSKY